MGRLPALGVALVSLVAVSGCNDDKKPSLATGERSQAVTAVPTRSAPAPVVSASAAPRPKHPPRKLCAAELEGPSRDFPKKSISRAAARGASEVPAELAVGGTWTWVNFWAAWCVPCKEEMPRLVGWEKKLTQAGKPFKLVFVSLDDDKRQLDEFLSQQPPTGVRASYWLIEGKEREGWLGAAEVEVDPELPTHLLVDPQGKVRCRIQGAVEDSDYASLLEIVSK